MKTLTISVPSKTFLLGEYVALKGELTLLLSSEPRFKLIVKPHVQNSLVMEGIHPDSPGGRLIYSRADFYQQYHIQFIDPYQGLGGFGASSAQFLMLTALYCYAHSLPINDTELLASYMELAWSGEGIPPSGADLIAQLYGSLCLYHKSKSKIAIFSWPFSHIDYGLIHTGHKLATHHYLKQSIHFDVEPLEKIVVQGIMALEKSDSKEFIQAINHYADALKMQDLIQPTTQTILQLLLTHPDIYAAKGCGALGTDVIFILFNRKKQKDILNWIKDNKLYLITYGHEVSNGIEIGESICQ